MENWKFQWEAMLKDRDRWMKRAHRAEMQIKHLTGNSEEYFVLSVSEMEKFERMESGYVQVQRERDHLLKIFLEADLGIDSIKKVELIMGGK